MKTTTLLATLICSLSVLGTITSTATYAASQNHLSEENILILAIEKIMGRF